VEKELAKVKSMVVRMPTLPADRAWTYDENQGFYVSAPVVTNRTRKTPKALVLHPGTDRHPPQVTTYDEDQIVGHWTKHDHSGGVPVPVKAAMMARVDKLIEATRVARAGANDVAAPDVKFADDLFRYIAGA
jgi:hypothetical protein